MFRFLLSAYLKLGTPYLRLPIFFWLSAQSKPKGPDQGPDLLKELPPKVGKSRFLSGSTG